MQSAFQFIPVVFIGVVVRALCNQSHRNCLSPWIDYIYILRRLRYIFGLISQSAFATRHVTSVVTCHFVMQSSNQIPVANYPIIQPGTLLMFLCQLQILLECVEFSSQGKYILNYYFCWQKVPSHGRVVLQHYVLKCCAEVLGITLHYLSELTQSLIQPILLV